MALLAQLNDRRLFTRKSHKQDMSLVGSRSVVYWLLMVWTRIAHLNIGTVGVAGQDMHIK